MKVRGRSCPLTYRYEPEALGRATQLEADTIYVVGGLYGNPAALQALLERADREPGGPPAIVFNGDFHWLDEGPWWRTGHRGAYRRPGYGQGKRPG